jgi:S-adenosylhomocysteine hydrolase
MFGKALASVFALFLMTILVLVSASVSADAKGRKVNSSVTGSGFTLVVLNSTDGLAHWGGQVTFTVSTTATTEPHVSLRCSQNGILVYATQTGFYAGYLWPWTQVMTLSSVAWTGGSADCVAALYYFSGANVVSLGTLSFTAYP